MRILAILLAAGGGRRIGGCKALLDAGGESFLERCAGRLLEGGAEGVIAVTGAEAESVEALTATLERVECVRNPQPEAGMLASLLIGLERAERRAAGAVLVHPVDHPAVASETVVRAVEALREGAALVAPSWQGRRGHPGGFGCEAWPWLRALSPERGARQLLADHTERVVHVAGDPGCRLGIDTPADFAAVFGGAPSRVRPPRAGAGPASRR